MNDDARPPAAHPRTARRGARSPVRGAALAVIALACLGVAAPAAPAAALSCAEFDFDAMGLAAGSGTGGGSVERGSPTSAENWRTAYDGVVLGTVTEVGSGAEESRVTHVEVTGAFGPPVPSRVEVTSPDSVFGGDGLDVGEHFLIPYREPGFESSLCDPIFPVAEEDVAALVAASESGLWPRPADAPAHRLGVLLEDPVPEPAAAASTVPSAVWFLAIALPLAGLAAVLVRRRRAAADRTPST